MKRIILIAFLLITQLASAQWWPLYTLQRNYDNYHGYNSTSFFLVDTNTTFFSSTFYNGVHGSGFGISKTEDSFSSFNGVYSCDGGMFGGCGLWELKAINADTAFIWYSHPYGYAANKTCNGGDTWISIDKNFPSNVDMLNGFFGYYIAGNKLFQCVLDTFYPADTITEFTNSYYALHFFDSLNGIVLLHGNLSTIADSIFRTADGGSSWTKIIIDTSRTFTTDYQKINDSVAIIHADSGYIYKTSDKGAIWSVALHDTTKGKISYVGEHTAYSLKMDQSQQYWFNISYNDGGSWNSYIIQGLAHPRQMILYTDFIGYIVEEWPDKYIIWHTNIAGGIISQTLDHLVISPNPSYGYFAVSIPAFWNHNEDLTLRIFNILGQEVHPETDRISNDKIEVSVGNACKGVYFLSLTDGKSAYNGTIVIE
jgi:hypothetical protein